MKSELITQEKNRVEIKAEFEALEFAAELKKVFDNISKRASIPGFRKGHVPRKTIEMRFGLASIHDEAIENLLNESISKIIEDYELDPLVAPQVKERSAVVEGAPVSVSLVFENRPEINLPELDTIEVERLITALDDDAVDEMMQNLFKSRSTHKAVGGKVEPKSIVSVDFTVSLTGDKKEKATISMEEAPSTEFYDALLGKSVGDKVVVEIANPNKKTAEENETIRYDLEIIEVGERVLPELTPEFFKEALGRDCADEKEFRDAVADMMLRRMQNQAQTDAENRVIADLSKKAEFEVPAILIHKEIQTIKATDERDAKERYKTDLAGLIKMRGMEQEEYDRQVMLRAWSIVRTSLILDELGKKFEIKIEPADLDVWIKERSVNDGIDLELLHKAYYRDKNSINLLADRVFTQKTVKALMERIKIKDVNELTPPKPHEEENENKEEKEEQ